MSPKLIRGALNLLKWALCAVGAAALLLIALVATPLAQPPEMRSISESRNGVDFSTLPAVERFQARDGTMLGFRHYPGKRSGHRARRNFRSRLLRLERDQHPRAVGGAGGARRGNLGDRHSRPRRLRHARRHRLCRPA